MALSMDEQRILEEIERRLADEEPVLAARLTAFGHPGLGITLRSRRGRMLASLIALVTLAVISVAVYAVLPLAMRHAPKPRPAPAASQASSRPPSQASSQPPTSVRGVGNQGTASAAPAQRARGAVANPSASRSAADSTR